MIFVLLIILGITIYKIDYAKNENYHLDYMSVEKTTSIKGIFVLIVFLSHFVQYIELNSVYDKPYIAVRSFLGQLVVTMFLFYSGYGIFESIKKKGSNYIDSIPKNRILKVLFDFSIAIIMFLIIRYSLGYTYKVKTIILAFIGWTSVGNSNWYIFAILMTYLFTYIGFKIFKKDYFKAVISVTVLSVLYILIIRNYKPLYSYNTILCYVFGMWYSMYKDKIESIVEKSKITYLMTIAVVFILFIFTYKFKNYVVNYQIKSILFVFLVVLISMKVSFNNYILNWAGKHVFSIYVLQRIPMMLLKEVKLVANNTYLYLLLSLIGTIIISLIFDSTTDKLYNKIFYRREYKNDKRN